MTDPARRPWWWKKRWAAVLALWLAIVYPLSLGPALYCQGRGWLDFRLVGNVYGPLFHVLDDASLSEWEVILADGKLPRWRRTVSDAADAYWEAAMWCGWTGKSHRSVASD